ncbi:hypothetical protein MKK88_24160 [Methylobacterium sp. E-005]|uniref:hypothetical protein n=1 Tax=Methylobacterium sp. E-005 TaxID=2836549 RepID=UPI001FBA6DA8|nr:hypothetical protein [Methylobacterium sp. E-005]MCJ2089055.1 hypothetical protein [Methylobacterium sp. E-005]
MGEIALPTVLEFKANRLSRRHAYLACIATFHIKDWPAPIRWPEFEVSASSVG